MISHLIYRLIPIGWLMLHDWSWRERVAYWAAANAWMVTERELRPLFWWFHDRSIFNGFYIDRLNGNWK